MSDVKKQLNGLLSRMSEGIQRGVITSERDLENFVRVVPDAQRELWSLQGATINPTLLEVLGYSFNNCDDHPMLMTIIGHTKYCPDYVLGAEHKVWAIWDLKAPNVSLNDKEAVEQIQSYCARKDRPAPIGVLFNGKSIRVFLNPEYPGFSRYLKLSLEPEAKKRINFYENPVEAAEEDNLARMTEILLKLSSASLTDNAAAVVRKMAQDKIKTAKTGIWFEGIQERLQRALAVPNDDVIASIAAISGFWDGMEPEPTPIDAVTAWNKKHEYRPLAQTVRSVETQAKQSINGLVRLMVAKVCAIRGWDCLIQAEVKGLRYRFEGGNGYHPVSQTDGVPSNLHVGGLSTGDAKKVIQQLELLLKQ